MPSPFDRGRAAAKRGKNLKSNPFDRLQSQREMPTIKVERQASEWIEGWYAGNEEAVTGIKRRRIDQ